MILVIDNYDSFTWNLVQYLRELGAETAVRRNDEIGPEEVRAGGYAGVVISPGPGRPEAAGNSEAVVRELAGEIPMLGICLGLQAMARVAGCRIVRAPVPVHGKTSLIHHDGEGLFRGLPDPFPATRYHSLVVESCSVPAGMKISAWTGDGLIMGLRAGSGGNAPLEGVQFHPESILTRWGKLLMKNFHRAAAAWQGRLGQVVTAGDSRR